MLKRTHFIPGISLTILLAVVSYILSQFVEVSANLLAILLGFIGSSFLFKSNSHFKPGIRFCESHILAIAVALLGAQLNVSALLAIDLSSLFFIVSGLLVTFLMAFLWAKIFRVNHAQACLIASGQGICGSAAVMASQSIIKVPAAQAGLVVALVNFLGFLGVFITVWLDGVFFLDSSQNSGMLIGNTLQSMGHVVAAGFSVSDEAGQMAVLIKMGRILLLIPVLLLLIFFKNRQSKKNQHNSNQIHWLRLIPLFIWVFLLLSFLTTMGWIPEYLIALTSSISQWMFLLAMAAIGLNIEIRQILQTGGRMLLLTVVLFALQLTFSSLFLIYL
jgi:uncharacterized integral membrane protein (TIGR00698 family)